MAVVVGIVVMDLATVEPTNVPGRATAPQGSSRAESSEYLRGGLHNMHQ